MSSKTVASQLFGFDNPEPFGSVETQEDLAVSRLDHMLRNLSEADMQRRGVWPVAFLKALEFVPEGLLRGLLLSLSKGQLRTVAVLNRTTLVYRLRSLFKDTVFVFETQVQSGTSGPALEDEISE